MIWREFCGYIFEVEKTDSQIKINIWSDIICPYCRLGHARLVKALDSSDLKGRYQIIHKAFRLAPGSRTEKVETALAAKFNLTEDAVLKMQKNVEEMAAQDGIKYDLHGTLYGDTTDAHRLVLWAAGKGAQLELLNVFFRAYFTEKINIFDRENLLKLVASIGLNRDEGEKILLSDNFKNEVLAEESEAHSYGAQGVPFFVFAEKYAVSGAQPVSVFSQVIEKLVSDRSR
ncbi:MAG: dithiol-disulfide isomerase [Pseudobdellovibrio sp.]|nr:dithiol-disulfide isomerase [Pseudobdellovibrio sp.]